MIPKPILKACSMAGPRGVFGSESWKQRDIFCSRYSWAVPSQEAIELLVGLCPLVEIGAGLGLWAHLVARAGGDVIAYDIKPTSKRGRNSYHGRHSRHHPVIKGGARKTARYPGRTLFLCWPPMSNMAHEALRFYRGNRVVYVGEWRHGCTADDAFHGVLDRQWNYVSGLDIPQWYGLHDTLTVWERK